MELTTAEEKLVNAAIEGNIAAYSSADPKDNDPAIGSQWDVTRSIRAEVIYDLMVKQRWPLHARGIRITGARIAGQLDFTAARLSFPVEFTKCFFEEAPVLSGASARTVSFSGSHLPGLAADRLNVSGDVFLDEGFKATGEVSLEWARIGGQLRCSEGTFQNDGGRALDADGLIVSRGVFWDQGFGAVGEVRLPGARIGGQLVCRGGTFENKGGPALSADSAVINADAFLDKQFKAVGEVRLVDARIRGNLSCDGGTFENIGGFSLNAQGVSVDNDVSLRGKFKAVGEVRFEAAKIGGYLICSGSSLENSNGSALDADGLTVERSVFLDENFKAEGEVRLLAADIKGQLNCSGGSFENKSGHALSADNSTVGDDVLLGHKFRASGEVRFPGATIGGQFRCSGGTFENTGGCALDAAGVSVGNDVFLDDEFVATGEVRFAGAKVGGEFNCTGGTFENGHSYALNAYSVTVGEDMLFDEQSKIIGELALRRAEIKGHLACSGGTFVNKGGHALSGDHLSARSIYLDAGFNAVGQVSLPGADIKSQLVCRGATFENREGVALLASGASVGGDVFLDEGFKASGGVSLPRAIIGGELFCCGTFQCSGRFALLAEGVSVDGDVWIDSEFMATGEVNFESAKIGGFVCTGAKLDFSDAPSGDALSLKHSSIRRALILQKLSATIRGDVNLMYAVAGQLGDDQSSWPEPGGLFIEGFEYSSIVPGSPADAESRLKWIELGEIDRGGNPRFSSQPYEQLTKVLRAAGDEAGAREVYIAKHRALRKKGKLGTWGWLGNYLLDLSVGYGYRARNLVGWFLIIVTLGWLVFSAAQATGVLVRVRNTPTTVAGVILQMGGRPTTHGDPSEGSTTDTDHSESSGWGDMLLSSGFYSLDLCLPFGDLARASGWRLHERHPADWQFYLCELWSLLEMGLGWTLAGLLAAALSGLMTRQ